MSQPLSMPQTPRAKQGPQEHDDIALGSFNTQKAGKVGPAVSSLLDPNDLRRYSISPVPNGGRLAPQDPFRGSTPDPSFQAPRRQQTGLASTIRSFFVSQWHHNGGPLLIILAQLFGSLMNLSARLLELEDGLRPMQILFARMAATIICCFGYMWYQHIPSAPWGPREIRPLLILRACAGFVGLYGMWSSIMYLPLAEATVISFLAPNVAGYLCRIFLKEPFTRREQLASYLALAGVVLITRPVALFSSPPDAPAVDAAVAAMNGTAAEGEAHNGLDYIPTIAERLSGIGMGLLGVVGGAITITVLRAIGPRAHPLISVNYFSMLCTLVSTTTLSLAPVLGYDQPALRLMLPSTFRQWGLLTVVGLCGFGTQFSLTAGLAREKSNRATGMIYTHVLFAAGFDRFIFGHTMDWVSVAGCGMVVGSALWVAVKGKGNGLKDPVDDVEARGVAGRAVMAGGEDIPMLANVADEDDSDAGAETEGLVATGIGADEDLIAR